MCGIFGIVDIQKGEDLFEKTRLGLLALQHRGQESVGICFASNERVYVEKEMGLVSNFFSPKRLRKLLEFQPRMILGHVRYSTKGGSDITNAQPHWTKTPQGRWALASNGDIPNLKKQRAWLEEERVVFYSDNDAELLLRSIVFYSQGEENSIPEAIKKTMEKIKGTYSAALLTPRAIFLFRDPFGNRPFVLGKKEMAFIFASETCVLDTLGADFTREVKPGEVISIDQHGIQSTFQALEPSFLAHCIFELIYFARPDSVIFNEEVGAVRYILGKVLAEDSPSNAEFAASIPASGDFGAVGFASGSGLRFRIVFVSNRYIGRTFILPGQKSRRTSVREKFNIMRALLKKRKRVCIVDDSIVRATTLRELMEMLRGAGAEWIDLRVTCPPYRYPCYFGIDTPNLQELIAAQLTLPDGKPDVEAIRKFLNVDTLAYQTLSGLKKSVKRPQDYCYACFTGKYPIKLEEI